MSIRRGSDVNVLETKRGADMLLLLVFVPMFCIGLAGLADFFGLVHIVKGGNHWPTLVVGLWFTLFAGLPMLGRDGAIIDRQNGTVTVWWGLLVPISRREHSLRAFEFVSVVRYLHFASRGTPLIPVTYRVYLAGSDSATVDEFRHHEPALHAAHEIADFLKLPLQDNSQRQAPPARVASR